MVVIDFNSLLNFGQYTFIDTLNGLANALRTDCFLTTDRLSAETPIRQMCSTIQRQLPNKNIFLFRSIPLHGICSDNLSSESERHRNLPAGDAAKTLPLRHPRKCFAQHFGKGKRKSRLANICRVRSSFDKQSSKAQVC